MNYINTLGRIIKGPYIPVVHIQGPINQQTTMSISQQLKQINPKRCDYLGLVINSQGGSLCQTHVIQNEIQKYTQKYGIELLTFSQNQAVKEAFLLLGMGQKVICQQGSIIGYKDKQVSFFDCQQFIQNRNISMNQFKSNNTASSIQSKLVYNGIDNQTLQQFRKFLGQLDQIENTGINLAGCQDQLMIHSMSTYDKYLYNLYPNAKVVNMNQQSRMQTNMNNIINLLKLSQSRGLPLLIMFMVVKFMIKVIIVIFFWDYFHKH